MKEKTSEQLMINDLVPSGKDAFETNTKANDTLMQPTEGHCGRLPMMFMR